MERNGNIKSPPNENMSFAYNNTDNSYESSSGSDSEESNASLLEKSSLMTNKFMLPKDLCDVSAIFDEFFSHSLWDLLPSATRQHLVKFLPVFEENQSSATQVVHDLLSHKLHRFGVDPLLNFRQSLAKGNFRADIVKLQHNLANSLIKERRMVELQRMARLAQYMVLSREVAMLSELHSNSIHSLTTSLKTTADQWFPLKTRNRWVQHAYSTQEMVKCRNHAKKRYLSEIVNISDTVGISLSVSDEEDFLDAMPTGPIRKQRRIYGAVPQLCHDILFHSQRNSSINISPGTAGINNIGGKKSNLNAGLNGAGGGNAFDGTMLNAPKLFLVTEEHYRKLLLQHRKRKVEEPDHPELDLEGIKLKDVVSRTQIAAGYRRILPLPKVYISESNSENIVTGKSRMKSNKFAKSYRSLEDFEDIRKINESKSTAHKPEQAKLSSEQPREMIVDLIETPLKAIIYPSEKKSSSNTSLVSLSTGTAGSMGTEKISTGHLLGNKTHACFLSVVRDLFCSNPDHRSTMSDLQLKLDTWIQSPAANRCAWYGEYHNSDSWHSSLHSAVQFLAGEFCHLPEDFVPYIEHKVTLNILQWIGASRDGDSRLVPLCAYWQNKKQNIEKSSGLHIPVERSVSPPPPLFPTDWSVRKATDEEINSFREQEKRRYENPHMSFTFKQHSYDSVVGPVKGIYTQVPGISKARGHSMLVADRPNFVTILTLVRDATARLPNGEGTRADICELLKSSQYISRTATDQVLQTIVSGALDRMHTEHDPCVKYDAKRKIWIYLHRNRTEQEFERLHMQYQGFTKHRKPVAKKSLKYCKDSILASIAPKNTLFGDCSFNNLNLSNNLTEVDRDSLTSFDNVLDLPSVTITPAADDIPDSAITIAENSSPISSTSGIVLPTTSLLKKQSVAALLISNQASCTDVAAKSSANDLSLLQDRSKESMYSIHHDSTEEISDPTQKSSVKRSGGVTLFTSVGNNLKTIQIPKSSLSLAIKSVTTECCPRGRPYF
ncbi:nuclear factor related to kappa-B-binding protein [Anopheles nili]|uniref:nuclear factor related to kappa-B-binding protein n=1 Tax=Anopheles nili TaxID=185578 RepID=UPI00237ACF15|nr:nuclear factor related to kappa-B-binding protein [Anopheles nili]